MNEIDWEGWRHEIRDTCALLRAQLRDVANSLTAESVSPASAPQTAASEVPPGEEPRPATPLYPALPRTDGAPGGDADAANRLDDLKRRLTRRLQELPPAAGADSDARGAASQAEL